MTTTEAPGTETRRAPRIARGLRGHPWPLLFLAAPAFVAVWSGWVELGAMTGFGKVNPLPGVPGVPDDFTINTAITLPVGVEAYAAFALGTFLSHKRLSDTTRRFAGVSAVGALILGAAGQVAYHLLEVADKTRAPWWITTIVSCLPVVVLGLGATLAHLIRRDAHEAETEPSPSVETTSADLHSSEPWTDDRLVDSPRMNGATVTAEPGEVPVPANGASVLVPVPEPSALQLRAAREFADEITTGTVPGIRAIRQQLKIGQPNAQKVRDYLSALANQ